MIDDGLHHQRVVGVQPERFLLVATPLRVAGHDRRRVERRDVAAQPAAIGLQRPVVHKTVAHVQIEQRVERNVKRFEIGRRLVVLRRHADRREHEGGRGKYVFHNFFRNCQRIPSNGAGCSRFGRWPENGISSSCEFRMARCIPSASRRRNQRVFRAMNDERRHVDLREQRRRVAALHHRRDRGLDPLGRVRHDEVAHVLHEIGPIALRRRAEQLRHHLRGDRLDAFAVDQLDHLLPVLAPFFVVGAGARRDEADRADVARRALQHLEQHVAAHRASDDGRRVTSRWSSRSTTSPARSLMPTPASQRQVGRDRAPSFGHRTKVRFPHRALQWERMEEHDGAVAAVDEPRAQAAPKSDS